MARSITSWLVALVTITSTTVGCSNVYPSAIRAPRSYFAIRYRIRPKAAPRPVTNVRQDDKFTNLRTTWSKAVVRAPDTCSADRSCTSRLTEIERGLVDGKLMILSSTALRDVERTKGVSTQVAAREVGADVVFVINTLEVEAIPLGTAARASFEVFETDERGRRGQRLSLPEAELDASKAFVRAHVGDLQKELEDVTSHVTATLDVTAIDVASGDAVWFYQKQEVAAVPVRLERRFMFAREGERSWPVYPHLPGASNEPADREGESQVEEEPPNTLAEQSKTLSRSVIADFLSRLRGG